MAYNRTAAIDYARKWALGRNPQYYDFEGTGGDCTAFASQCLYAGAGVMNYTRDVGWYYNSQYDRAAAWTGVEYFAKFLTTNKGSGPYGRFVPLYEVEPGDFIQLSFEDNVYSHTLLVMQVGEVPAPDNILIAAHSFDSLYRPLDSYYYKDLRVVHIEGVRG